MYGTMIHTLGIIKLYFEHDIYGFSYIAQNKILSMPTEIIWGMVIEFFL